MFSKETVLNNCYQEMTDVLMDLLKYEFVGVDIQYEVIELLQTMINHCQEMIDNIDNYEWSDVMKVNQTYYQLTRLVNVLLMQMHLLLVI